MALTLNLFLPGTGQLYLGQTALGLAYGVTFAGCCVAILVIFVRGYRQYIEITAGGGIFEGNNLEKLGPAFHVGWLIGLLVIGVLVHLASLVGVGFSKRAR